MLLYEELSGQIIDVHSELGCGLLESAYEECLAHEFRLRSIMFRRQVPLPVQYKGLQLECVYRMDFVVEDKIVLELKAVDAIHAIHQAQVLTYLRLSNYRLGLLVNFNSARLVDGIKRIIN